MKQLFNENTLCSKYIQALLADTYLPIMDTVSYGDIIMEDTLYATSTAIIKCSKSGVYGTPENQQDLEHPTIRNQKASWKTITNYSFGNYHPKFTERFTPTANYYDSKTHEKLGKYLRCYRDFKGIDLMPFYNCFSDSYLPNVLIEDDGVYSYVTNSVKVIKIPIRFNKKYYIAIDCSSQVKVAPVFLAGDNFLVLKSQGGDDVDVTEQFLIANPNLIKTYPNLQFKQPVTYEVSIENTEFVKYSRNLYLLIQLPYVNHSSVVVLEGNYQGAFAQEVVVNAEYLDSEAVQESALNQVMLSPLSLLQFSDGQNYPFANRLMEYLLGNVIGPYEEIQGNVAAIQQVMPGLLHTQYVRDVWNQYTRKKIFYQQLTNGDIRKLDLNGFFDKDTEDLFSK